MNLNELIERKKLELKEYYSSCGSCDVTPSATCDRCYEEGLTKLAKAVIMGELQARVDELNILFIDLEITMKLHFIISNRIDIINKQISELERI